MYRPEALRSYLEINARRSSIFPSCLQPTPLQSQVQDLTRIVSETAKELREFSGQMKGIEKRFDDKDKLIDAIIAVRVADEVKKALSEISGIDRSGGARIKIPSKRRGAGAKKPPKA